jgi:hypothetical protein
LDGRVQPNESLPESDVFYTLNVLLGLSRLSQIPNGLDVPATFERNVLHLPKLPVAKYAFGMALWAAAQLKLEIPKDVERHIEVLLSNRKNWSTFRAQDLGMILTGIVAQIRAGRAKWYRYAGPLFTFAAEQYVGSSGLFLDAPVGPRRRFASFASQIYLALACYSYGEFARNSRAVKIANACSRKLISLQGPNGEWPWFFDAESGIIVDFYEIYSVHQFGMAPALLECAERQEVPKARDALIKGFKWVLGDNQLAKPMLMPEWHLSIRSQARKRELGTKKLRMVRAVVNASLRRDAALVDPANLRLRLECRSYELGWILWSFGTRSDLSQLTHNEIFINALRQPSNCSALKESMLRPWARPNPF